MSAFLEITEDNFDQEVLQSASPVLLEFGAAWCGPCQVLEPILERLAAQWQGKIRLAKVDVDKNVNLTMRYNVLGVPTLILFIEGEIRQRLNGYHPRERIQEKIEPFL